MSPLEGAKDINLSMHLLRSTEIRFLNAVYKHKIPGETKQHSVV